MSLVPELLAAGVILAWDPRQVATACQERLEDVSLAQRDRRRGYLREEDAVAAVEGAHALEPHPTGQAFAFEGQRPALAARGAAEAETALRGMVRQGLRVLVTFPH